MDNAESTKAFLAVQPPQALKVGDGSNAQVQPDWQAIAKVIKTTPLFILYGEDGREIRLFAHGPEGISGSGLRFENRVWELLLLLPREAYL